MLPEKHESIWTSLVTGEKNYQCQVVPASMLLARLIRSTQRDKSNENVSRCIDEAYTFFERYQAVLKNDIRRIFHS